jgi:HEAT repeat protein
MSLKLASLRLGAREWILLACLGGLLAYAYIPMPVRTTSDPVGERLQSLRTGAPADRCAAITELSRIAGKDHDRILPALLQALEDQDAQVRYHAAGVLHVVSPDDPMAQQAATGLIRLLRDVDPRVRAMAAGILSTLKPDPRLAIPALITAARSDIGTTAPSSAPSGSAAGPITAPDVMARNQVDHARASAVAALGVIAPHDAEVQSTLVSLADDAVPEVRMVAARTLGQIGPENPRAFAAEVKLASDPDFYIGAEAVRCLGSFPNEYQASCPILYRAYFSKRRPLQEGAELSLAKITKSPTFDMAGAARSQSAALRFAAAFGTDSDSEAGLQALTRALKDEDPGVRTIAGTRLGGASSKHAAAALRALESMADDKNSDARDAILHSRSVLARKASQSED